MKKNVKKLFGGTILTLGVLGLGLFSNTKTQKVFADEVDSTVVHIAEHDYTYLYGPNGSHPPVRMVDRLRDSNNQPVFCIDFSKPSPDGLSYHTAEKLDAAHTYLQNVFFNGGSSALTGDKNYDEYIVQAAGHYIETPDAFSLDLNGKDYVDRDGVSHNTVNRIRQLAAEAKNAKEVTTPEFSNSLAFNKEQVSSNIDGENYVSDTFEVNSSTTSSEGDIQVALENAPASSYLADETGQKLVNDVVANHTKLKVVIPIASLKGNALDAKVVARNTYKQAYKVAVRLTGNSGYQDLMRYQAKSFQEQKTAEISIHASEFRAEILGVKKGDNGTLLHGVEFSLLNEQNETVAKTVSNEKGEFSFSNVAYGQYYLVETRGVAGYVMNEERLPITINDKTCSRGEVGWVYKEAVNVTNKLMRGSLELLKVDDQQNKLAGAEFTLTDNEGTKQVSVTDKEGKIHFNLEANKTYTLEETKNPLGYAGMFKQENISIDKDGQVIELKAENHLKKGTLAFLKVDKATQKPLQGAEMTLTDNEGNKQTVVTDAQGKANFTLEANKTYTLEETKNPNGYSGKVKETGITLADDGQVIQITGTNEKVVKKIVKTGSVHYNQHSVLYALIGLFAIALLVLVNKSSMKK